MDSKFQMSLITFAPRFFHPSLLRSRPPCLLRSRSETEGPVYEGVYGKWTIDEKDKQEVFLYRTGLTISASAMAIGTAISYLPPPVADSLYNPLCFAGLVGFGLSLTQVHMYVSQIRQTIQALWLLGAVGVLYLAVTHDAPVPICVAENAGYVWIVGPFFASMTGLTIKEGLCYGKAEATLLALFLPATLLGHLSEIIPGNVLHFCFGLCTVLFCVLAGRKYSQPIKDDIGDKSVFMFLSLPEEEQIKIMREMN